jgi:hypothetical protein
MFLLCFLHDHISFSYFHSSKKHVLYNVFLTFMLLLPFSASYNSFYNFFFYVSNTLIFCYPLSFVGHGLYGFDKKFTMLLPCFTGYEPCLLKKKYHILRVCSR